ncbi:MAG TPA: NlpC/P60 family protein [Patescibacteria group bacterium]|nr:NlpC/P60 family protein [Patescibacteria group bacterium]
MPVPIWAGRYIGLPFAEHGRDRSGVDCWGLVRLALFEQYNITLPSFDTDYQRTNDALRISALVERESLQWRAMPSGAERCGDVIVLRMRGLPLHVGLVLGDRQMLHVEQGIDSAIEKYTGQKWRDRIYGFYRYEPVT